MNTPDQFNAAWAVAQSPEVQTLIAGTPVGDARNAALIALANKGMTLDPQILELGLPPYWVMQARVWYGYFDPKTGTGWVPMIGKMLTTMVPGIPSIGSIPAYDPNSPPDSGSVKVVDPANCNLATEYPPAIPPAPPAPPVTEPMVDLTRPWPDQGPNVYYSTWAGRSVPDGTKISEGGKEWIKISVGSMFVPYEGWKQA